MQLRGKEPTEIMAEGVMKAGVNMKKSRVSFDYKSFAKIGLQRFEKEVGSKTASFKKIAAKEGPKRGVHTVKLSLNLKPEKMEAQAAKIRQALEQDLFSEPMVTEYMQTMLQDDYLPELQLARKLSDLQRKS